jgi:hypothetical protein
LGEKSLFIVGTMPDTLIQPVPHRKHITYQLQTQPVNAVLGKESLFIATTVLKSQIQSVGRMQSFGVLKPLVHTVTLKSYLLDKN